MERRSDIAKQNSGANLGFERELWQAADAQKLGTMIDRVDRELTEDDIRRIADTYHLWRGDPHPGPLPEGEGEKTHYRGGFDFSGRAATARELGKKQPPAEAVMWKLLRNRRFMNLKLRRQHPIGKYVVDFFCNEHKLVTELAGPIHSQTNQAKKDKTREAYMRSLGLMVIRFSNDEFLSDPESTLKHIAAALPSPGGRGAGGEGVAVYRDIPDFCKAATIKNILKHGHILTPGRNVGAAEVADDLPAQRPGVYFLNAIACEGGSYYIGHTDNIPRRWQEHVSGKGADWTRKNKPRYIAHYEEFTSLEEAVALEKELKTTAGRRWLKKTIAEGRARQAGGGPFKEKMARLTATLREQTEQSTRLDQITWANLEDIGYGR